MSLRILLPSDLGRVREIHEKFYKEQFDFPDFYNKFLGLFVATNDNNQIVAAGGIKSVVESYLITNQDVSIIERREALLKVLEANKYVAGLNGFDQIFAFVQEDKWKEHLEKVGFKDCKGKAIYLNL